MQLEISAGAVLYYDNESNREYVLVRRRSNGECGSPKGHIEAGETEEMAALREMWEECCVHATLISGFREVTEYDMPNGNRKRVIYFVASCTEKPKTNPEEPLEVLRLPYAAAMKAMTFDNSKAILEKAEQFLKTIG
ncbi:MAG: bis(5'-nucleosyl)-tetraphosphatase [Oscillospiraceae bacterium]